MQSSGDAKEQEGERPADAAAHSITVNEGKGSPLLQSYGLIHEAFPINHKNTIGTV
jgi:hypothetical protein